MTSPMDTTTNDPPPPPSTAHHHHLVLESIPIVDIRLLSQSELNSLSLCSSSTSSFDLTRCDDVVIPKIDRSVFNESAGSRKQTYSRLRLAPPRKPDISTVLSIPTTTYPMVDEDPDTKENKRIISSLRQLFGLSGSSKEDQNPNPSPPRPLQLTPISQHAPLNVENGLVGLAVRHGEMKKRGRKRKAAQQGNVGELQKRQNSGGGNGDMEIVNRNGVVIDIAAVANADDVFGAELSRRTAGLETEEALLGFMKGLEGQWGSRRKKRRIVDASEFGDMLPVGWKLLLGFKRKEGIFWLNCRRYISPNGQQFVSCKDASSYLLSLFGSHGEIHLNIPPNDESDPEVYKMASGSTAGLTYKDDNSSDELIYSPASPMTSLPSEYERQIALLGTENLAEVEIRDLLECHICKKNFQEKEAYLQHLMSSHQKSAKKCRLGTSICDGVIIKDDKYECQFCHKVFDERRRYNSHVGVHVRNYVRSLEASPGDMTMQKNVDGSSIFEVPPQISQVEASATMHKDSVPRTTTSNAKVEIVADSLQNVDTVSYMETPANSNSKLNSPHSQHDITGSMPQISTMDSNTQKADSPLGNCGLSSFPEEPVAKYTCQLNVGSGDSKEETSASKLDEALGGRSWDKQHDSGDVRNADKVIETDYSKHNLDSNSSRGSLRLGSIQEEPTTRSTYELDTASVDSKHETGAQGHSKVSGDRSHDKKDSCYETSSEKVIEADFLNNKLDCDSTQRYLGLVSIPEELNAKSTCELNVGSEDRIPEVDAHKIDADSGDRSHDREDDGYERSADKVIEVDYPTNNVDCDSTWDYLGLGSIPVEPNAKSTCDLNVESVERKQETDAHKIEANSGDRSHGRQDGSYGRSADKVIEVDFSNNNRHCDSTRDYLGLGSIPEESSAKSTCDLNVEFVVHKQETDAHKLDESSRDGSHHEQDNGYERNNDKVIRADYSKNNLESDLISSLDSASFLCNNDVHGTRPGKAISNTSIESENTCLEQEVGGFDHSFALFGSEKTSSAVTQTNEFSFISLMDPKLSETIASGSTVPLSGFERNEKESHKQTLADASATADEVNIIQSAMADTPQFVQPDCFPTLSMISDKGASDLDSLGQKLENVPDFEELRLNDMGPSKFEFATGLGLTSLPQEPPMDMAYDAVLGQRPDTSVPFEWETVLPKMDGSSQQQVTTVCVWCRLAFSQETLVNPDMQSDSVGFICPACKTKMSSNSMFWTMG